MNDVIPPAADATAEEADAPPLQDAPARPGKVRRILLTALPAVLVIGAVGGAAAYTTITVDGADRSVGTTVWDVADHGPLKDPAAGTDRGRADTELGKLMLPVPPATGSDPMSRISATTARSAARRPPPR